MIIEAILPSAIICMGLGVMMIFIVIYLTRKK